MNLHRLFTIVVIALFAFVAAAQNFTRPVPSARSSRRPKTIEVTVLQDTVLAPPSDSIALAGFEKPLRSVRESLFVTNRTSRPLVGVTLEVSYYDLHGNLMHRAERYVAVTLPAGETRRVGFPSFDRQQLFYYHLSPLPRGAVQATPFDVKVRVVHSVHPHLPEK